MPLIFFLKTVFFLILWSRRMYFQVYAIKIFLKEKTFIRLKNRIKNQIINKSSYLKYLENAQCP